MEKGDPHRVKKAQGELEAKRATIMWGKTCPLKTVEEKKCLIPWARETDRIASAHRWCTILCPYNSRNLNRACYLVNVTDHSTQLPGKINLQGSFGAEWKVIAVLRNMNAEAGKANFGIVEFCGLCVYNVHYICSRLNYANCI